MKIAIGSDHRGYRVKGPLLQYLRSLSHEVRDFGCHDAACVDYTDIVPSLAASVARSAFDIGILISGSGTGMCMAANKIPGVRAAAVQDGFVARRSRERHNCNVLCLGADLDGIDHLQKIVDHFLAAETDPAQHAPSLEKLSRIEQMGAAGAPAGPADGRAGASGPRAVAEVVNRARDRLLAVLSHELRTPLTPAWIASQSLARDMSLPRHVREEIELIHRSIESEIRLIDSILDATRIANGKLRLSLENVDAHGLLSESVGMCRPEALAKLIDVRVDASAARHTVRGDSVKLQQVFCNLLKNAIKFSGPRSGVTVRTVDNGGDWLKIEVLDTGIGIAAEVLPRIFDPFEQGSDGLTDHFGGLGLGLAICKGIVEAHGGIIYASSEGAGKGASLSVVLPLAALKQLPGGQPRKGMFSRENDTGQPASDQNAA